MPRSNVEPALRSDTSHARDLPVGADSAASSSLEGNPKAGKDKGGNGKGRDAAKKAAELERKVNELIGKGKIRRPPAPRSNKPSPN